MLRKDFSMKIQKYKRNDELSDLIKNVEIMRNQLSNSIRTLELKANIDGLTGLYNRRFLMIFTQKMEHCY